MADTDQEHRADEASADAAASDASDAPPESNAPLLYVHALTETAKARLTVHDAFQITEDETQIGAAAALVVATRIPEGRAADLVPELLEAGRVPLVALVHPGGEHIAIEITAAGGSAIVAEGNEEAILTVLSGEAGSGALIDAFDQHSDRSSASVSTASIHDRDPVTNLPGAGALEDRLGSMAQAEVVPRYGAVSVLGCDSVRLGNDAATLLGRRLGTQLNQVCRFHGAVLFSVGRGRFAIVAESLTQREFDQLGSTLAQVTASFAPDRAAPLVLAMGHAGPESAADAATVRELAERGLAVSLDAGSGRRIVGAEELTRLFSTSTELETLLQTVSAIEATDPMGVGHGARTESLAADLAEAAGCDGPTADRIRLAARLHEIGKIHVAPDDRHEPEAEAYRSHPSNGADLLRAVAEPGVVAAIKHQREAWDGSGYPDQLTSGDIPLEARVVAVADAVDRLSEGAAPSPDALTKLQEAAATRFDPSLVEEAQRLWGER